jgi:hypothetical protein
LFVVELGINLNEKERNELNAERTLLPSEMQRIFRRD